MNIFGIGFNVKNVPELQKDFVPVIKFIDAFDRSAQSGPDIAISIERDGECVCLYRCKVHGMPHMRDADFLYVERIVKFLLWQKGGNKITIYGDEDIAGYIASVYRAGGKRGYDAGFMAAVYEKNFQVAYKPLQEAAGENSASIPLGGNLDGCRIGFDAGGSDRKVSAVIDGKTVFSEEVVWHPKTMSDPDYHYEGILSAFCKAASYMPRVDAIGVSSAGIFVNNRCMRSSLFIQVPEDLFKKKAMDIFIRAAAEFNAALTVCNDGDVAALAGMMGLNDSSVLGIALGTSEAAGFVDEDGNMRGWLNELAFAPVDLSASAAVDPWSGDAGVGAVYFSQDAVIRLAGTAGIPLAAQASPAEKLKAVQALMDSGDRKAEGIYSSIGVYLGHSLALYHKFYACRNVLLMGRVMSGRGGDLILETAKKVLAEEYPHITNMRLVLPDEKMRRVGQSVAAASLPKIG